MKYAYNTEKRAVERLTPFNRNNPRWTAKLNIGRAVGHTSIDLYAGGIYAGSLAGDILGSALYRDKNDNGLQGANIPLTWQKVLAGVDEVYLHGTAWGTWFCHDITAAVFRRWGMNGQDVYHAAYPHTPGGRVGLVTARLVGFVAAPVTTLFLGGHEGWNAFQNAWNSIRNFRLW